MDAILYRMEIGNNRMRRNTELTDLYYKDPREDSISSIYAQLDKSDEELYDPRFKPIIPKNKK